MNVKLGKSSQEKLASVDKRLQSVVVKAFEAMPFDVMVLEGIRTKERQKELVAKGASKTMNSKHLTGRAIDLAPYPIDWNDKARFNKMADVVLAAAKELGIKVRWGGDWNQNGEWKDERFYDGPHFELVD
jgi:peptidoglycan L-alanyl-D-glutamate endopeptidase CwlK